MIRMFECPYMNKNGSIHSLFTKQSKYGAKVFDPVRMRIRLFWFVGVAQRKNFGVNFRANI